MSSLVAVLALVALVAAGSIVIRRANAQPLGGDAQVIEQLREAGSNLTKPHTIEFFMYFPTEASAKHVAERLNSMGFKAVVKPAAAESRLPWLALSKRNMIPTVAELERLRRVFSRLCDEENGEYDGWGPPSSNETDSKSL